MKENIATIVQRALLKKVAELGLELYEVEYKKKQNGMNLTLFITKPSGQVTLEDCRSVHKMADTVLDELNPTNDESYILNVSSLGLDKLLKTDKDFYRVLGEEVEVTTFQQIEGSKHFIGVFECFDDNKITLKNFTTPNKKTKTQTQETLEITRENIASCKLLVKI